MAALKTDANESMFVFVKDANTGKITRTAIPSDVQIGLMDNPSELQLLGRLSLSTLNIVVDAAQLSLSNHDTIVNVTVDITTFSSINIALPSSPRNGQLHFIKDASGTAATTSLVISPSGNATIDGGTSSTINFAYGTLALYWSDDDWHVLVRSQPSTSTNSGSVWIDGGNKAYTTSSISITSDATFADSVGQDVYFYVSGSIGIPSSSLERKVSVFGGDVRVSGSLTVGTGSVTITSNDVQFGDITTSVRKNGVDLFLSDTTKPSGYSLSQLAYIGGDSQVKYLVISASGSLPNAETITAGANISFLDGGPGGNFTISATVATGSGADVSASYITVSNTGSLPNERALAVSAALTRTDGGAGGAITLGINDNVVATISGSTFTGPVIASAISGSIQQTANGISYLVPGSNITIVSQSNGQIVISSTGGSSAGARQESVTILAGIQYVDQVVFQAIAAFEFNPTGTETMAPSGSTTYTAFFQPIVEVFPTGCTLETQLYNVTAQQYVASSLLSSSQLGATRLRSSNLSGSLNTGSNTYEMHMRITNAGSGKAYCKGAKLFVTWQ